ncbi:MAG: hypothetical protein GY760_14230 [Deltaproteobacteria bacterium]|nr:hypothetical protein [Deltaproteobacteria bacterium]
MNIVLCKICNSSITNHFTGIWIKTAFICSPC